MNQEKYEKLRNPRKTKVIGLIEFLKENPKPISSIKKHLDVQRRSVFLYIDTLKQLQVGLKQDELKKYYIDATL
jgi:DNA-binding IclR family transcriptional regulator